MSTSTLSQTASEAIPLSRAADYFPLRPHQATVWRWAMRGTRGVKLQTWLAGGKHRYTTPDAIAAFLAAINADNQPEVNNNGEDDAGRRGRDAGRALESMGL